MFGASAPKRALHTVPSLPAPPRGRQTLVSLARRLSTPGIYAASRGLGECGGSVRGSKLGVGTLASRPVGSDRRTTSSTERSPPVACNNDGRRAASTVDRTLDLLTKIWKTGCLATNLSHVRHLMLRLEAGTVRLEVAVEGLH